MFTYKKLLTWVLVLVVLLSMTAIIWAGESTIKAGEETDVNFEFSNVQKLDGAFAVSDPQGVVKNYTVKAATAGEAATTIRGARLWAGTKTASRGDDIIATVHITLKDDAAIGSKCTVTFNGMYMEANDAEEHFIYKSATVEVIAEDTTENGSTTSQENQTGSEDGSSQSSQPETTQTVKVNTSELQKQITIASGLNGSHYSKASASILKQALSNAKTALNSTDQATVDAAEKALKSAVAGLKKINYAGLKKALSNADMALEIGELTKLGNELEDVVKMGNGLLSSEDQEAVDAATERITDVIDEIEGILGELRSPEIIEVEIPVEIPPKDDYCNIPTHKMWPMLLFLSLALNVVLVALIVTYTVKKKKYQNDDTPLVTYDIDDDF